MRKKKSKGKIRTSAKSIEKSGIHQYNYNAFKARHTKKVIVIAICLLCFFLISVFKNISYPLFWADESMTAIGTDRVLRFGYPKVHDGKNVFYDLRHSNPKLGINESNDAYVGGTGWGHYYFGVIGYKLTEKTNNIYVKTGLYRITYAIAGLMGLFLLGFFISKLFADRFSKYAFASLFILLEVLSVSLALLVREVRYYSLTLLLLCLLLGLYCIYRFYKPLHKVFFISSVAVGLWLLFNTFAPAYFIVLATLGLSEVIIGVKQYSKSGLAAAKDTLPVLIALVVSFAGVYPLLSYFKTFEIADALREFNGYNNEIYWTNVATVFDYFKNFELLWLAVALRVVVWLNPRKLLKEQSPLFSVANFLSLFFIVFAFAIATIPNFIYTRYIIYLQPFLSIIIILDFFMLLTRYSSKSSKLIHPKMVFPILIFLGLFMYTLLNNLTNIEGHIYEITHRYKGPLDYTIPYLKEKYQRTDTLTIAAAYEETSYEYYLKSKVIVGFVGNNLAADSAAQPDVIAFRRQWGDYAHIFNGYFRRATYEAKGFPVKDNPVNNIPEMNFMPWLNHQFRTRDPENEKDSTRLFYKISSE